MQNGWQPQGTSNAFDREVWAGYFTLSYGKTLTITLQWTVPSAVRHDAHVWHYQYLIQKQAGTQWKINLQVTLPACALTINPWGGLISRDRHSAELAQPLIEDINVGLNYTC
jgi:hypothetical protein